MCIKYSDELIKYLFYQRLLLILCHLKFFIWFSEIIQVNDLIKNIFEIIYKNKNVITLIEQHSLSHIHGDLVDLFYDDGGDRCHRLLN